MKRLISITLTTSIILAAAGLTGCGKKDGGDTNVIEMNASDGSMNDMTVVESSQLDLAGAAASNSAEPGNASNAM